METTICFLNDKILVLSGMSKGNNVYINCYKTFELSEGSIINGVITNNYSIKEVLNKIKADKELYFKKVRIVIDSSLIYIKKAVAPKISQSKLNIFVENEFVGLDKKNNELIFDYSIINTNNQTKRNINVVCYATEKSLVKSFIDIFAEEKINILSIDISTNCIIKFASCIKSLAKKTYVIANVDRNNISLILFVDNSYYYSTRARLLSDIGTEDFYQEISSQISSIVQFNKSQRNGFDIEEAYICGLTDIENSICSRYISDLKIRNSSTIIFNSIITYSKKMQSMSATDYVYNIGTLLGK